MTADIGCIDQALIAVTEMKDVTFILFFSKTALFDGLVVVSAFFVWKQQDKVCRLLPNRLLLVLLTPVLSFW